MFPIYHTKEKEAKKKDEDMPKEDTLLQKINDGL